MIPQIGIGIIGQQYLKSFDESNEVLDTLSGGEHIGVTTASIHTIGSDLRLVDVLVSTDRVVVFDLNGRVLILSPKRADRQEDQEYG